MELGAVLPQTEIGPDPDVLARFATAAEGAGLTFLLAFDHVLGADITGRSDWPGPYDLDSQFHEVFVLFGYLAGLTRMELMPGVLVLPQRQAVLVAKQSAEIDVLTGGNFKLGVGIGWNPVEYEALGVDFHTRAALYEEQIEVLRLLWTQDAVTFNGRFHTIDRAGIRPRSVQRPIPIWMGGGFAPKVLERIGRLADGWVCNMLPGHGLEAALEVVRAASVEAGRPADAVQLQGIVQPRDRDDLGDALRRQLARWEGVGATRVAISGLGGGRTPEEHIEFIKQAAGELVR
jgi:probable F420-dependent oxidoreductase